MADEEKREEKKCSIGEIVLVGLALLLIVFVAGFLIYTGVVAWTTPETVKMITIKNIYGVGGKSSWTYIEDTDCVMYATSSPSIVARAHAGETRTYKIKFYDRVFLPFESIENRFPEIVGDVTKCK